MHGRQCPIIMMSLIAFVFFDHSVISDRNILQNGETDHFKKPSVPVKREYCSGSSDGKTELLVARGTMLQRLRNQYANCTRVWGNLEITFITDNVLRDDGADPDSALQFLEHIEEVTGYVLIYANSVRKIPLSRLRIIWGDSLYFEGIGRKNDRTFTDSSGIGLFVYNNPNLDYIDLRNLRSVERGKIVVAHSKYLCFWRPESVAVDFDQLVGFESHRVTNFSQPQAGNFAMCPYLGGNDTLCHANCTDGRCWGPGPDMCQIIYRRHCPISCESKMCWKRGVNPEYCCHKACAGGCTGPRHDQCIACKLLEQDSRCVEQCNGLSRYNHATGTLEPHDVPRYTFSRHCVLECPSNTVIQGAHCVTRCDVGNFADTEKGDRHCTPCRDACPKRCFIAHGVHVSARNIDDLINCTMIEGTVMLLQHVMTDHTDFDSFGVLTPVRGLTADDLEKLSSIRVITDCLEIQIDKHSPESFGFLRNLRIVEGRRLGSNRYAITITTNANLKYLGLTSLIRVRQGRVYIGKNPQLCLADSINWTRIIDHKALQPAGEAVFKIIDNRNRSDCERTLSVCDSKCQSSLGCWGPGDRMCFQCADWHIGNQCVLKCPLHGYYEDPGKRECIPCHPECQRCHGEGPENCTFCNHVSIFNGKEGLECLAECPPTHFDNERICQPCHQACYLNGCTGPKDTLGIDGCKRCRYAELSKNGHDIIRCLSKNDNFDDFGDLCKANGLEDYFPTAPNRKQNVEAYVCKRCKEQCLSCTGYGTEIIGHGCQCAMYELIGQTSEWHHCVQQCPINSHLLVDLTNARPGICESCHELCDPHGTCTGPSSSHCSGGCKFAGFFPLEDDQSIFNCSSECPPDRKFQDDRLFCYDYDILAHRQSRRNFQKMVIIIVIVFLLLVLLVLCGVAFVFRHKYKEEALYNAPPLPDLEPVDPRAQPNMSRLHLISADQLSRSASLLGSGAFGVVYAGYWWPDGKGGQKVPVAIKLLHDGCAGGGNAQQGMLAEAGVMAGMRHPHLLRLVGVCLGDGLQLVAPLRPLGSLLEFLKKHRQKLAGPDLLRYGHQIADAMEYLERHRLVHRDLAARNVLVKSSFHVEVTDFGLAKLLDFGQTGVYVEGKVAVKWLALECLAYRRFTHKSDVWAFGVTFWEVLTFARSPYGEVALPEIKDFLRAGRRLEQPDNCSQELYQLLLQCWMEKETARPTFLSLFDTLSRYMRRPQLYVQDGRHRPQRLDTFDQRFIINELLQDADVNCVDPLHYFDQCQNEVNGGDSMPDTPTSPETSNKPLMGGVHSHRLQSTGSSRYQGDPMDRFPPNPHPFQRPTTREYELNTDGGNYLIPNARNVVYTPVVIGHDGENSLVKPTGYYNDLDVNSEPLQVRSVTNKQYMSGIGNIDLIDSETTV